jgi:hypothetical protein
MKEAAFVFQSDVDAEARRIEENFRESLHILTDYMKHNIKGKGMEVVRNVMAKADLSSALRLTNFNHDEECQRREDMRAVVSESVQICIEAAKRLVEEEETYVRMVDAELARIAAEAELKRLADEESLKLLVDRALKIAEIETQNLAENQEMAPQQGEDHIMLDQNLDEPAADKGKAAIVDTTPPKSPLRLIQGSPSLAIPSAVQMALDEMKNEMKEELRSEIDELRADMNRSGEATHKKIDEMMQFLLKIASQLPKS